MECVAQEFRQRWTRIFDSCLRAFVRAPSLSSVRVLFLASKALLAAPRREGKARAEAISRMFRMRFALWDAGDYAGLWTLAVTQKTAKAKDNKKPPGFKHNAHLVDCGLLLKAAARCTSRGVEPDSPEVFGQVKTLFPAPPSEIKERYPESAAVEVTPDELEKLILRTPCGLAPGPSGLRAEHLRTWRGRTPRVDEGVLDALTSITNVALGGYLPQELQTYLCGGFKGHGA